MKKIIAFICAILIGLFTYLPASAAGSPGTVLYPKIITVRHTLPAIKFNIINRIPSNEHIFALTIEDKQFVENVNTITNSMFLDGWVFDEAYEIEIDKTYDNIQWHFTHGYSQDEEVVIILTDKTFNICYVIEGYVLQNGDVLFDFSSVDIDSYYMFVIFGIKNVIEVETNE